MLKTFLKLMTRPKADPPAPIVGPDPKIAAELERRRQAVQMPRRRGVRAA